MAAPIYNLLIVDDEESIRFAVGRYFTTRGYQIQVAGDIAEATAIFARQRPDVMLLDYSLPDGDGLSLLASLRRIDASVPAIILTGYGTIDLAVRAVKEGAEHVLTKPVEMPALRVIVERLIENQRNRQVRMAGRSREARQAVDPFLGDSPAIRALALKAERLAGSSRPILIQGETGTGKGILAVWLHQASPRAEDAFVDLNCGGLSRELFETELFGHEKGAFTGALAAKTGLLEVAHRGTLFLDEIGDLPVEVQPKLLKVLEEQRFRRLGEVRDRQVDVRLIAASHHDLGALVRERRFREDLYFRVSTLPLVVPALRERGSDALVLARFLLARVAAEVGRPGMTLAPAAERAILQYPWPGNVRELRNVLERAVLLAAHEALDSEDLFERRPLAVSGKQSRTLEDVEAAHVANVLRELDWRVPEAAKVLGLSRSALYKKMQKHGIARANDKVGG